MIAQSNTCELDERANVSVVVDAGAGGGINNCFDTQY